MSLPSPLQEGVDYYVLNADSTHIQLSETEGGDPIDITDTGTMGGQFEIIRQGTAEYKLEIENACGGYNLSQLSMAIDANNKVQPSNLTDNRDIGEGGVGWNSDYSLLIQGYIHRIGDNPDNNYVFSVQRSRVTRKLNICSWKFWSVETSSSILEFGDENTKFRGMVYTKNINPGDYRNKILIGTSDGIYVFNPDSYEISLLTTDNVAMIDNNIKDIVTLDDYDYVWVGHETGLSRIRIADLNCVQYLNTPGGKLEGLVSGDEFIRHGMMSIAHGGDPGSIRILIGGMGNDLIAHTYTNMWMLEEISDVPRVVYSIGALVPSCALRDHTNQIVLHDTSGGGYVRIRLFDISYSGSWSQSLLHSVDAVQIDYYQRSYYWTQMNQISDKDFIFSASHFFSDGGGNYRNHFMIYRANEGMVSTTITGGWIEAAEAYYEGWRYAFTRYKMHAAFDEVGNSIDFILDSMLNTITAPTGNPILLGYDNYNYFPGKWVVEKDYAHPATKTANKLKSAGTFIDDIVMAANNAVGKPWDEQFIATERFTFMYGDVKFKDNLQTLLFRAKSYYSNAYESVSAPMALPAEDPCTYHAPEALSDPNFRDIDNYDLVTDVTELAFPNAIRYSKYTLPGVTTFTADIGTDILSVGVNIATGTPLYLSVSNWRLERLPLPLKYGGVYFAINISPTTIKLALTRADALLGNAIDLLYNGYGTYRFQIVIPTTETYFLGLNGVFVFSQDDIGKTIALKYTVTTYN